MIGCCSISSEVIRDVIVSIAAICGTYFAYLGIREWKRKNIGEEKIKYALNGLTLSNQLKEETIRVRDRATYFFYQLFPPDKVIQEIQDTYSKDGHKVVSEIMGYMSQNGLKELSRLHDSLDEHTKIMEALTDSEIRLRTNNFLTTVRELIFNIRKYVEWEYYPTERTHLKVKEIKAVVFSSRNDDPFNVRIKDDYEACRSAYLKIIKKA